MLGLADVKVSPWWWIVYAHLSAVSFSIKGISLADEVCLCVWEREISVEGDRPNRQEQGGGTATGLTLSSGTCTNNCGRHVKHCCTHVRRVCVWGRVLARADFSPCCVCMCVCCFHVLPLSCKYYTFWSVIKSFCMRGSVCCKSSVFCATIFFSSVFLLGKWAS